MQKITPTGIERYLSGDDIIVSKTDLKGRIQYANRTFLTISEFTEQEVLGQPHNMIRHPDMPRCLFRVMWNRIQAGHEIFVYVINLTKSGGHYWVLAHVTPSRNESGEITGFHSNRRSPKRSGVEAAAALYRDLVRVEKSNANREAGLAAGMKLLEERLAAAHMTYDEWVFSLSAQEEGLAA